MKKTSVATVFCFALTLVAGMTLRAGGVLETFDITAGTPSPIAGHLLGRVIGIRWDDRAIPVKFSVNDVSADVPNPLGAPVLTLAEAAAAMQAALDGWNELPSSYIQMDIVGTVTNPGLRGFDFVNELTFNTAATFTAIASSPSVALMADATLVDGDDIDEDGDSDVSSSISVTTDVDFDGDLEFPAGFYKAGTILDNDVQYNTKVSNGFRFTVGDGNTDTVTNSVDLITVAIHEFGHSHGLSHSMDNVTSETDGDGATMFPFIDTGDPASEIQQRSLHTDDIAWSSYLYPEGTQASGPGALQHGDIAFRKAYGLVTGEIRHGVLNQPIAGASVFAVGKKENEVVGSGFSGTTQLSFDPATGGLFILPNPADGVLDGKYTIPVPAGSYGVGIEAVDGSPAAAGNIGFTCQIGGFYGQLNFNEEFYTRQDDDLEVRPGRRKNVHVNAGRTKDGIDIVTNNTLNISNFGALNAIGFINSPEGRYYATAIPAAQIAAFMPGENIVVHSALFHTIVVDGSVTPVFSEALLTTGTINPDGTATVDLDDPLDKTSLFVGQDNDFSPLFVQHPRQTARRIRRGIENGTITHVFLVLRIPTTTPYPGVSGQPPLVGLNNTGTLFGLSFISNDGVSFTPVPTFNFRFSLVLSATP
jgi:Matrixin